jgi:hypothetical protein
LALHDDYSGFADASVTTARPMGATMVFVRLVIPASIGQKSSVKTIL